MFLAALPINRLGFFFMPKAGENHLTNFTFKLALRQIEKDTTNRTAAFAVIGHHTTIGLNILSLSDKTIKEVLAKMLKNQFNLVDRAFIFLAKCSGSFDGECFDFFTFHRHNW